MALAGNKKQSSFVFIVLLGAMVDTPDIEDIQAWPYFFQDISCLFNLQFIQPKRDGSSFYLCIVRVIFWYQNIVKKNSSDIWEKLASTTACCLV